MTGVRVVSVRKLISEGATEAGQDAEDRSQVELGHWTAPVSSLFLDPRRYDLGKVGRFKINKRLGFSIPNEKVNGGGMRYSLCGVLAGAVALGVYQADAGQRLLTWAGSFRGYLL